MHNERLSTDALQRISGPSWGPLKDKFLELSSILLSVSNRSVGVLTTIYVKFQLTDEPASKVFAVIWLKTSKELIIGLSLPEDYPESSLEAAFPRTKYLGINKYFKLNHGDDIPESFAVWASEAYSHATKN